MKKILLVAGLSVAMAAGSASAFAASPSDVAIGLVAGGLLGAAIGSSSAQPAYYPAPTYYAPAPAYTTTYVAPPAPVYYTPAYTTTYYAPAPAFWVDAYGYRHYYHHHHHHYDRW